MRALGCVAVVAVLGCGASVDWSPAHPETKDYPQVVEAASRVHDPAAECSSGQELIKLGVVHADGDEDEVIPAIAKEAAEHGGTHYVVEGDKTRHDLSGVIAGNYAHLEDDPKRATWAVVYRCQ